MTPNNVLGVKINFLHLIYEVSMRSRLIKYIINAADYNRVSTHSSLSLCIECPL